MNSVAPQDSARNLLFGLLAFQNNFIDRRALLAAFDAWTTDKSRPLGHVLVEHGAISEDLFKLIDGLVEAHLSRHDNQPEKSLAVLTPISSLRKFLDALADPETRASLARVSSDREDDDDPDATKSFSVGKPTSAGVRFHVLRPLNKGGMGVVSVALDTELDRSIALKEIRDTAADNREYRARFLAEAEITGKLEHPGIIPIYGLGTYGDGRPFYAMRLIRGDKTGSLMDAITRFYKEPDPASRVVEFRGLLRRFLDVCNAMSYAHSKGVLHRDLKPDNILLGPYGETLVVDWGLAKAVGRADPSSTNVDDPVRLNLSGSELSPTLAGGAFGTPEYAPPEQMIGDLANIGPRSDVYGLGAVLYSLMTGRAPFSRKGIDLGKLIQKIEEGDFPPPRQIRADIDKPLEAICLKAIRTKPADRYESVRELADDVERYLADEPVTAYREPWTVRARRWTRKHRTAVTAGAVGMVVAVVGLAAITVVLTKARNDLALQNLALDKQRRRAELRETQAIDAVKRFGDVISQTAELKDNESFKDLRKSLLKEPIDFFRNLRESLQADSDASPESLTRLAAASFEVGSLSDEIGDKQDALIAYRESLAIQQTRADANPSDTDLQHNLGIIHYHIGRLLSETGKPGEALTAYESARAIRRKLAEANPSDTDLQHNLGNIQNSIGLLLSETGKPGEAMTAYKLALEIQQKLTDANPTDTDSQSLLALIHYNVGVLLSKTGKPSEALTAYESARTIQQKLTDANPTVTRFQCNLAASYNSLGVLLRDIGRSGEALKAYESSQAILQELADNNPTITRFQSDLAAGHYNIGNLLGRDGKPTEALKEYDSALVIAQKLADANPSVTAFQSLLARTYNNIGMLERSGKPAEALNAWKSALTIKQKLADANPTVTNFQYDLAISHNNIGNLLSSLGKPIEARRSHESALQILIPLTREHPESPAYASSLAGGLNGIAAIELDAKRFDEAVDRLRQAIIWQKKALASNPSNPTYRQFLANHLTKLVKAAQLLGDPKSVADAESELAKLREPDPAIVALDQRLAAIIKGDQQPKDVADRLQLAERAYHKALCATAARLWAEALVSDPKLADDRKAQLRYNAASAAALAGSGRGIDLPKPDNTAKAKLRAQALGWLKAELTAWKRVSMTIGPGNKDLAAKMLAHWKQDADLAGVRESSSLDKIPETERTEWRKLWADVDSLLATVNKK